MNKKAPPPQPVQLPTDTYILSLNKKYAKVETNANNQLLYSLKNPIKLNVGDQVSLYKSYLNIRGLNSNTITLDDDFDVQIKTGLFIPASIKKSTTTGNNFYDYTNWCEYFQTPDPNGIFLNLDTSGTDIKVDFTKTQLINTMDGKYSYAAQGDFNSPYIGVKIDLLDGGRGGTIYKPVSVVADFKITAGQYDVNALALEITNQLNGSQLTGDENQNIVYDNQSTDRTYNAIFDRGGTFTKSFPIPTVGIDEPSAVKTAGFNNYFERKPILGSLAQTGNGIAFLDLEKANSIMEDVKKYVLGDKSKSAKEILGVDNAVYEGDIPEINQFDVERVQKGDNLLFPKFIGRDITAGEILNVLGHNQVDPTISLLNVDYQQFDNVNDFKVNPIDDTNAKIGWFTNVFKRTGGGQPDLNTAIYGWTHLTQQFYFDALKSVSFDKTKITRNLFPQAQEETNRVYGTRSFTLVFNNENRFSFSNLSEPFRIPSISGETGAVQSPESALGNQASKFTQQQQSYPQECSSGNFVLSFDDKLVQQTARYKEYQLEQSKFGTETAEYWLYEWALTMLPHDFFYDSVDEGKNAWEDSIWNRLGFSYEQLGNITPQLEKYNTPFATAESRTSMLGFTTHNSYGSSLQIGMSGLGQGYSQDNKGSVFIETFDEVGLIGKSGFKSQPEFDLATVSSYITAQETAFNVDFNYVFILANSQFFNAETLPDLSNGKNYFLVESDLIPSNYLDESTSQRAILGFIDKEFSSNDTIFSSTAIPFTMKQGKIVNTVMINILNADGTKPIDSVLGDSSAFLIMIQRNSNAIFNYLESEEIQLIADESTRPTTQTMTE